MRRVNAAGLLGLGLGLLAGAACSPHPPLPEVPVEAPLLPPKRDDPSAWLPAYTPAQLALLTPVSHTIQTPATRVLPDLQRFWYANNRPLRDPGEAVKFTRMVATVLSDSPRFYSIDEAPAELENPRVQYGPPPEAEPDGFLISKRGEGGVGELVPAPLDEAARASFTQGTELSRAGNWAGAVTAFRAAVAKSPKVPALRVALADALVRVGNESEAEMSCQESIAADPTYAPAYLTLAEISERRHDGLANKSLAEALAYQPNSRRGLALSTRLGSSGQRIAAFPIFLDVDAAGAIHAASPGGNPSQIYAGCRAVMRYEPEVRAQIFEQPRETPYYLSVVEEVVCVEAALGAYLVDRSRDKTLTPDPKLEALLNLAHEDGLSGYVMFEILGQHRPERARVAPPEVHRAIVRYVERHVLGQKHAPEGVYNASLSPRRP